MKEATGELNMTVVTLIAIAAIAGLFYFAIWPMIQQMLIQQTCNTYGPDYKAVQDTGTESKSAGQAQIHRWCCCPKDKSQSGCNDSDCVVVKEDNGTTTASD